MTTPLINKYRPKDLKTFLGNEPVKRALMTALHNGRSRAFLLSGPSGTGKTTLARIGARLLGATPRDINEVDAATYTGVENMRKLQETLNYGTIASTHNAIVIDECGRLSAAAWESTLKTIEEPPDYLSWWFCTTDLHKVPKAIKTRCVHLALQPLPDIVIHQLVDTVLHAEKSGMPSDVRQVCVKAADGSARQALTNITTCLACETAAEARELLRGEVPEALVSDLCQLILKRGSWLRAVEIIARINADAESIRLAVCRYFSAVLRNSKNEAAAVPILNVLEQFAHPCHPGEGLAPLYLSVGRVLFTE